MDIDFYDAILLVLGLFFGRIVAHIFIYSSSICDCSLLKEKEDELNRQTNTKGE